LPSISAKGFPGNRVDAYRAGIIPIKFMFAFFIYLDKSNIKL